MQSAPQETIYIGIWQAGRWCVYPVESVTDELLAGLNILRDVRATVIPRQDEALAARQLGSETARGVDPHYPLHLSGHDCRGLELLRENIRRARQTQSAHEGQ